ncbi:hypothetical protein [Roseovarius sp. SYSU LYC5161]|uniref:hypothetical protein n=1 Tax=Roseovarius halophilus (ex Wu et al. 2025) TaxID=3376060 RepID=UPI00399A2370
MSWATEFPEMAGEMPAPIPSTWRDDGWRHDASPCFTWATAGAGDTNFTRALIWVDSADPAKREGPGATRFLICYTHDDGEIKDAYATDSWAAVLKYVLPREALGAAYVAAVGYNPFLDDPDTLPGQVARDLEEIMKGGDA